MSGTVDSRWTHAKPALSVLVVALFAAGGLLGLPAADGPVADPPVAAEPPSDLLGAEGSAAGPVELPAGMAEALEAVRFEPNQGQLTDAVRFFARGPGVEAHLKDGRIEVLSSGGAFSIVLPSAVVPVAEGDREARSHYYLGNDPSDWRTAVPHFDRVRYPGVAPGVDLVLHGERGPLEMDHIVAPGADPADIRLGFEGAVPVVTEGGALEIPTEGGAFRLDAPIAYQDTLAGRVPVEVAFDLQGDEVRYQLGAFDPALPLVIDPVIGYSSYLGTSAGEVAHGVEVIEVPGQPDLREVHISGRSSSPAAYPPGFSTTSTSGPADRTSHFVAKFSFDVVQRTMTPLWFTYIGGSGLENEGFLSVDDSGRIVLGGETKSDDYPTMDPIVIPPSSSPLGDPGWMGENQGSDDIVVVELDPSGQMQFASHIGGSEIDIIYDVLIMPGGDILVAGYSITPKNLNPTMNTEFPLVNATQERNDYEATLSRIRTSTSPPSFVFSTFLGGSSHERITGMDVTSSGIVVAGYTYSDDFPTTPGAFQPTGSGIPSGFAAKLAPWGHDLLWSTYVDGSGQVEFYDMALDAAGDIWLAGYGTSNNFPVCPSACVAGAPPPLQASNAGGDDMMLAHLKGDGSDLLWGSYLGGPDRDRAYRLALDANGNVLVVGETHSPSGLPVVNALQNNLQGPVDGLFLHLDANTKTAGILTYLGGTKADRAYDVASDSRNNIYITGSADVGFPTQNAVQGTFGGGLDAFVTVIMKDPPVAVFQAEATGHPVEMAPASYQVLTHEAIRLDGSGSLPGEDGIDPSLSVWELKDDSGTVLDTATGTWTPVFPSYDPLVFGSAEEYEVCLTVDDGSGGPFDHQDTECMDLEWLNRPPVADATSSAQGLEASFVDASTDPDGTVVDWHWDFGDGTIVTGTPDPVHTFASSGSQIVTLTVTDDHGATDQTTHTLEVQEGPQADFSFPSGTLLVDNPIAFTDLSVAGGRPIATWTWDFGDGSDPVVHQGSVPSSVPHTFESAGTFEVTLHVDDGHLSDEISKDVVVVDLTPKPSVDQYVAFLKQDLAVGASEGLLANDGHPQNWPLKIDSYTEGEGFVKVQDDGAFTYTPPDGFVSVDIFTYHVSDGNQVVGPVQVEVDVRSVMPPVADFRFTVAGNGVAFEDRSQAGDIGIAQWRWVFSDGSEAFGRTPHHTFSSGHHSATLHVTDVVGVTSSVTKSFQIAGESTGSGVIQAPEPFVAPETPADSASEAVNHAPTAVVSGPAWASAGETVRLDGGGSSDPDGDTLSFQWRQLEGPPVELVGSGAEVSFAAPHRQGVLVFGLEVSDGQATDVAEVQVAVSAPKEAAFAIEVLEDGTHWFNATTSGSWSFGDGTTAEGASVSHRFAEAGTYAVRFEVDGVESVQLVHAEARTATPVTEPAVHAEQGPEAEHPASVPDPRIPTAVTATAAGVGLLALLVWAYRTWALVWIRVFTRVGRPELLDHPLRSQIHDLVQERPGIVLTDLVGLVGKSRRTVLHHVSMLEAGGMLTVDRSGRYTSFHPAGTTTDNGKETVLRSEVAQRLMKAAKAKPGQTVGDLTKRLGVDQSTVSYHVGRLEAAGLVTKVREGRVTRLFPSASVGQGKAASVS